MSSIRVDEEVDWTILQDSFEETTVNYYDFDIIEIILIFILIVSFIRSVFSCCIKKQDVVEKEE